MTIFSYHTLQAEAAGVYKEKGSKFLAFAYPVGSEAEIRDKMDALKREYFDARHHCYAWILGPERKKYRAFDDGEPNHSAGDPIMGQMRSRNLTNLLIVVVRYFGGVKLGVGGLINAYKSAAEDVLNHAIAVEQEVCHPVTLSYDYASTAEVMRMVNDFDLRIDRQDFKELCTMKAALPLRHKDKFMEKVKLMIVLGVPIALG